MFDSEAGPRLAAEVGAADPATLDDAGLLDLAAAARRVAAWAESVALDAAAAFTVVRQAGPLDRPFGEGPGGCEPFAADELAAMLAVSRSVAESQMQTGLLLRDLMPSTRALLRAGAVDSYKVSLIIDKTLLLTEEQTGRLDGMLAGHLAGRTPGQIRRTLSRLMHQLDPNAALARRISAEAGRFVSFTPNPEDGMTWLTALLPAGPAEQLRVRLNALISQLDPTDSRTRPQQRADTLLDLATLNPWTGHPVGRRATDTNPDRTADGPADGATAAPAGAAGGADGGVGCSCPGAHQPAPGYEIQVIVSASTLAGLDDEPAEIPGYGHLDADHARHLAAADATWRRILTDPATGTVLDVGRTTYRPPAALARHVRTRDRTCRFPGCRARRTDLDHTIRYPDGPTADHNLALLCRHHHLLKHHTGWQVCQTSPGTLEWTSPAGHTHTVTPDDR